MPEKNAVNFCGNTPLHYFLCPTRSIILVGLCFYNQSDETELLIMRDFIMVRCVLSQLKPSEIYIFSFEKCLFKAKNVEFLGLYPIHNSIVGCHSMCPVAACGCRTLVRLDEYTIPCVRQKPCHVRQTPVHLKIQQCWI